MIFGLAVASNNSLESHLCEFIFPATQIREVRKVVHHSSKPTLPLERALDRALLIFGYIKRQHREVLRGSGRRN